MMLILSWSLFLVSCSADVVPSGERVQVSQVVSGQTLEVLDLSGSAPLAERVRLLGVEAPDWNQQPWSLEAKTRLESLLSSDRTVLLESDVKSQIETQDGRTLILAYVWHNGVLLNEQLIEEGYALAVSRSPNLKYDTRLLNAQAKARLMGVGIWNPEQPMRQTPNDFRRSS